MFYQYQSQLGKTKARKYHTDNIWVQIVGTLDDIICNTYPLPIYYIKDIPITKVFYRDLDGEFPLDLELDYKNILPEILEFIFILDELFKNNNKLHNCLGDLRRKIDLEF